MKTAPIDAGSATAIAREHNNEIVPAKTVLSGSLQAVRVCEMEAGAARKVKGRHR